MFKPCDAFADAKVLLGAVLASHEKASGFSVVRVLTDLKRVEVPQLSLSFLVHLKKLLDEVRVISGQLFSILLEVKYCACLALNFVDVSVVDTGDFIARTLSLPALIIITITFLRLSRQFLLLFDVSELRLDAELIVTALFLPEGLEFLAKSL